MLADELVVAHAETLDFRIQEVRDWEPVGDYQDATNLQKVEFAAKGKVVRAQAIDSKPLALAPVESEYMERAFLDASAPCPAVASSSAEAVVRVDQT